MAAMVPEVEEEMPKLVGPSIPRWQLGTALKELRKAADISELDVAKRLRCSESKIKKIEGGLVGVNHAELLLMLDMFGVDDDEVRAPMLALQEQSRQKGWWAPYGELPPRFAQFLSLESSATTIRTFAALMVPGLLQTEAYARAISTTHTPGISEEQVEREVRLRLERQERLLVDPPELWIVLDEGVLHRPVGGHAVMADQLKYLARVARIREPGGINLHVIPYGHGAYPGQLGAFTIFGYDDEVHSPVVYVEGQGGNLYLHSEKDLARCNLAYTHMTAAALSGPASAKLINDVARRHAEQARTEE